MSITLLQFAKSFVGERVDADIFSNAYIELWKIEGRLEICKLDDPDLSVCLSSIFCLADLYNPNFDKAEYELDENDLRAGVSDFINKLERGV